jgi:protein gp37
MTNCEIKDSCYAAAQAKRCGWHFNRVQSTSSSKWSEPLLWNEEARRENKSFRVFVASLADYFDHQADGIRHAAWDVIRRCEHLTWMVLTKRPEDIPDRLPKDWGDGYPNVWLGTTITTGRKTERVDLLRKIPARCRFISAEPLLEPLGDLDLSGFDLLIVGGMSGKNWKENQMDIEWAKQARTLAHKHGCKFFFKQMAGPHIGNRPDALGELCQELPDGLYPWMQREEQITLPEKFVRRAQGQE